MNAMKVRRTILPTILGGAVASCVALLSGCAHVPYVWADEFTEPPPPPGYVIATGDVISVRVFNQEAMSVRAKVRADGKVAMPFLGDVEVRGKAPAQLSTELAARFKEYVNSPFVTVTLEEPHPTTVSVLGEVSHPGVYTVEGAAGVLQALAAAGGLTEYAGHDSIFVVRRSSASRIRFSIASLSEGTSRSAGFRLQAGDAVMVE